MGSRAKASYYLKRDGTEKGAYLRLKKAGKPLSTNGPPKRAYCHPVCDQPMEEQPDGSPPEPEPSTRRTLREHTLKDRIVEHLRATGTDSISGIARVLASEAQRGSGARAPVHRLTVAGYLQALAEAGVLRELDRPPSKLYQLQSPEAHSSLHQRVFRALQDLPLAEAERARLALAALQRVLERPVFQAELQHAGFHAPPPGAERVVVGDALRRQYRDLFRRRASPRIDVPDRDPLLSLPAGDPLLASAHVEETLRKVLLRATGAEHLLADRPAGPQQAQLSLEGP